MDKLGALLIADRNDKLGRKSAAIENGNTIKTMLDEMKYAHGVKQNSGNPIMGALEKMAGVAPRYKGEMAQNDNAAYQRYADDKAYGDIPPDMVVGHHPVIGPLRHGDIVHEAMAAGVAPDVLIKHLVSQGFTPTTLQPGGADAATK